MILDEAIRYLAAGLKPIPVLPKHKCPGDRAGMWGERHPTQKDWKTYQRRPPTEEELSTWFADAPGVGVGTVIPSGIIVVDFDGGKPAEAMLNAEGVVIPESAPRVMSGSGGYHAYLRLPAGMRDFAKLPGRSFLFSQGDDGKPCKPFVEILTINNFVVLPPTIHPNGKPYEWVTELDEIPEAPASLMALIDRKRGGTGQPDKAGSSGATGKSKRPGANEPGWVEELSRGAEYGTIDDSMTKLAGHYLRRRLSVANTIDILRSGFAQRCTRGGSRFVVPDSDIKRVVESVFRAEARKDVVDESEFQLLGYDHEVYYYLSRATGQVVELTARNHDKHNLLRLASLRYWEQAFGGDAGVNWSGAQALLLDRQHGIGVFDIDNFRGRGAWWDEDSGAVMHTGSHLIAQGKSTPIKQLKQTRRIYELSKPLDVSIGDPLDVTQSREIMEIFESLQWEHPHHARLAAGWCAVAAVCGAVEWRPHIWISGPSGSGKSWTVDHLVKRLLGSLALSAQSTTTEAGLRQALGHDARPVIFDEAEAEGQREDARMANVLGLIRQASSETGGSILKGSADGAARSYRIRSCFAMSSIGVSAYQAADRNRITILEMRTNQDSTPQAERDARFADLVARVASTFTDAFVAGFRARCIMMIPTIRENARTFSVAASGRIGSRRLGDQVGTLLAGAYALISDDVVTPKLALELVDDQDLSQQRALQGELDELDLLNHILQATVRVSTSRGGIDASISSCLAAARAEGTEFAGVCAPRDAIEALALAGIKATPGGMVVANSHRGVRRLVEGTHWSKDWGRVLRRVAGAELSGVVRLGTLSARGVLVPWEVID